MGVQVTVWPRGTRRVRAAGPFGVDFDEATRRVGTPLFVEQYGKLTAATASTRYEQGFGGHDLASWSVVPHGGYVGGLMRPGDHVQVTKGGGIVFEGEFSEAEPADDGAITLRAKGYAYNLYDYDAIYWYPIPHSDDIWYPTTTLGLTSEPAPGSSHFAWQYAVYVLGMPITNVIGDKSEWTTGYGDSDMADAPLKVGDLVTTVHQEQGERWAVWGRTLFVGADPTSAKWSYSLPDGLVGVADTDYATHVGVWYVSSDLSQVKAWLHATSYEVGDRVSYDGRWWQAKLANSGSAPAEGAAWTEIPTAYRTSDFSMQWAQDTLDRIARFDTRTAVVDQRGLGVMDGVRASNLAQQLLDQVKGRFILTGGFTIGPDSGFATVDGGKADIAFIRSGELVKLPGLRTDQGNLMDTDTMLIGKTEWSWAADGQESTQITPMGAVPRNLGDILRGNPLDGNGMAGGKP